MRYFFICIRAFVAMDGKVEEGFLGHFQNVTHNCGR